MTQLQVPTEQKLTSILSSSIYDIPAWARGMTIVAGLAGVVVVVVGSLEGGKEYTIEVDKLLHFGGYATLAGIFVLGLRPALFLPALFLLAVMGCAIEFIQPLNARSFDWADAVANVAGLVVGGGLGLIVRVTMRYVRTQRKRAKLQEQQHTFERGAIILRQGAPVRRFCVIEKGEVELYKELDGQRQSLGTMGPGDVFGLLGVIQSQPQYATVEALTDTQLFSLDIEELIESSGGQSEPVASILAVMAKHLREMADRVVLAEQAAE